MTEAGEARHRALSTAPAARIKRQKAVLAALSSGKGVFEACRDTGVPRGTYLTWRKKYKDFRAQVDEIRLGNLADADAPWQGDFLSFRLKYFGMETYWPQREIVRAIESTRPGEVTLVNIPPEFGKTTLLEDYCCYLLANDPNGRITTLSERQQHARKMIGRVQQRMIDPHIAAEFIGRFGPFYMPGQNNDKPWTADYFRVYKSRADERDFSMESRGWNGAIAGLRADLLVPDDIQSRKSLNQTGKMLEVIRQDVLTRARKGRVVLLGTRVGDSDVYEGLLDEGVIDHHVCIPAINAAGESTCPEMWSTEELERTRSKVGESVWWRNYMQRPQDSTDATFPKVLVESAYDLGTRAKVCRWPDRFATLDPALVNWSALQVWSYSHDAMQFVDGMRTHNAARTEDLILMVERAAILYGFQDLIIEGGGNQRGLINDERLREIARRHGFRIHEHLTGNNRNADIMGVARMPSSFIKEEIIFPGASKEDREVVEVLAHQLRTWRPDVDPRKHRMDEVMAMWFGWMFWQRRRESLNPNRKKIEMPGLPFTPLAYPLGRSA